MKHANHTNFIKTVSLSLFVIGTACSSLSQHQPNSPIANHLPLTLESADKIRIGSTLSTLVDEMFGKPRIKLPLDDPGFESWLYCVQEKCSQPAMAVEIEIQSKKVTSVSLNLRDGDPYQNLEHVRLRYPDSKFKHERYLHNYRDYFEVIDTYSDSTHGLIIGYDGTLKKVTTVTRSISSLQTTERKSTREYPKISKLPEKESTPN